MTEHLEQTLKQIDDRISVLRDELGRLEAARSALGGTRRRPGRPRGSGNGRRRPSRTGGRRPRGRPRGSGGRANQAHKLVQQNPGITISELAQRMRIKPNYLYRVMPELQKDGKVRKRDKGWHPA